MCLSTLFCANDGGSFLNLRFENDVKMYGTQANLSSPPRPYQFENDVKMYGTQARLQDLYQTYQFENDVKMYGTQAQF